MSYRIRESEDIEKALMDLQERLLQQTRPANEVILDDVDFCQLLKISKRLSASWRAARLIEYSQIGAKFYYTLAGILRFLEIHRVPTISTTLKIR